MSKTADITCVFGQRGSGKTTYAKARIKAARRLIVWDPIGEWTDSDKVRRVDAGYLPMALKVIRDGKNVRAVYTAPRDRRSDHFDQLCEGIMIAQAAYKADPSGATGKVVTFLVDEVHGVHGPGKDRSEAFKELVTMGRHFGVSIVAVTQFPTQTHPDLRRNAERTVLFRLTDFSAYDYVRQTLGPDYIEQVKSLEPHQALIWEQGQVSQHKNRLTRRKAQ